MSNTVELEVVFERDGFAVTPKQFRENLEKYICSDFEFAGLLRDVSGVDFQTKDSDDPSDPSLVAFNVYLEGATDGEIDRLESHLNHLSGFQELNRDS